MPKTDISVRELVDMIDRGELRLPELQRRYVWPATRVRDLLDSLYRGYPSGTILVWETTADTPARDLAIEQRATAFGSHKAAPGRTAAVDIGVGRAEGRAAQVQEPGPPGGDRVQPRSS
ncbi:MAG: DUF262 domain-containing protein [Acidimicrobiales bacterium]